MSAGGFLLDTNILSETKRRKPHPGVEEWFLRHASQNLYVSVLSIGEIRSGALRLNEAARTRILLNWLDEEIVAGFAERVLNVTIETVEVWARINYDDQGSLPAIDSLIAATAITHNLTLVSRDADMQRIRGLRLINPWL